jgi:hypothetical protein
LISDDQIFGEKLRMSSSLDASNFATEWVAAWNSHDLEAILFHCASRVVLNSPVAAKLTGETSGTIHGKDELRRYSRKGLSSFPTSTSLSST